jgi:hypothetical protein
MLGGSGMTANTRMVRRLLAEADRRSELAERLDRAGNPAGAAQAAEDAHWNRWAAQFLSGESSACNPAGDGSTKPHGPSADVGAEISPDVRERIERGMAAQARRTVIGRPS